jgi:hypothetical protein
MVAKMDELALIDKMKLKEDCIVTLKNAMAVRAYTVGHHI